MEPLKISIDSEKLKKDLVALEYPEFLEANQNFNEKIQIVNVSSFIF